MFGIFVHYPTRPIYDVSMNLFCWPLSVDIFNILPGFLWQPLLNPLVVTLYLMLEEKEKRPNNKREDEGKTYKIGEREFAIWKEWRAKISNDRLYTIHDSHWDKTSLWISIGLFIFFSNVFSEEFALSNCGTLPHLNSPFCPGGWYEEKCTYDKVFFWIGLKWVRTFRINWFYCFPLLGYAYLQKRFSGSYISAINFICG